MVARVRLNDPPSIAKRLRSSGCPKTVVALHLDRLDRARAQRKPPTNRPTPRRRVAEAISALNDLEPADLDAAEAVTLRHFERVAQHWAELASARMPPAARA